MQLFNYKIQNVQHSLFYDRKIYLKTFGIGGAVKAGEEEDDSISEWMTMVFVEQPLALPESAKDI